MLAGLDEPDAGSVVKPSGLTRRLPAAGRPDPRGPHALRGGEPRLRAAARDQGRDARARGAARRPATSRTPSTRRCSPATATCRTASGSHDGYSIDLKIATVLQRPRLRQPTTSTRPTETFSGGWQMRIALAKLLLGAPDLLLLDEPTNHLDLEARNWLEEYLHDYPHAVILVSHDRYFLDAVVTRIAELYLRTLTDYPGNYSHYLVEREARLERLREAKQRAGRGGRARSRCSSTGSATRRPRPRRCRAGSRCSRRSCRIEVPPERKRVHFTFPACGKSGRMVLELKHVRKAYGDKVVFRVGDLHIERGDRIALVGPNGAGKSTLMRMLSGVEAPDAGERTEGPPGRHAVLRAGRGDAARPDAHRLRDAAGRLADAHGAGDPQHPRRLPVLGRRRLQEGGRAVGRRAHAPGGRAHAAAARRTRCCSTSRPTTSTSTRRTCCSTRSRTTAAR